MRWLRGTIKAKFISTFLVCLILPLALLGLFFSSQLRTMLMDNEAYNISVKIDSSVSQLDTLFQEMNDIINSISLNYNVSDILTSGKAIPSYEWFAELKSFENFLESVSAKRSGTYHVSVLDMENKLYRSGARYNSFLSLESELPRLLLDSGGTLVLNRMLEGIDDVDMLTIGKAYHQNNEMTGLVFVDTPTQAVESIFQLFESPYHRVYLLNHAGQVLYSNQPGVNSSNLPPEISAIAVTGQDTVSLEGEKYLCARSTSPVTNSTVVVLASERYVFARSTRLFLQVVAGFAAVILLTVLAISFLSGRITENIKRLNAEVAGFSAGGAEPTITPRSADEVGQLTQGFVEMSRRINSMVHRIREDEQTKWQLEYQALQAQINPHMIYNTLNTITYLAQLQHVPNIQEVSSSFASLLRVISNHKAELVTVRDEVEILRAYITVREYNLLCDVETRFDIDPRALDCRIPKLLLQPLVENAYIHGFQGEISQGVLHLRILLDNGKLCITVGDNGVGIPPDRLEQIISGRTGSSNAFSNVGVYNTKQRLHFQYGEQALFTIESEAGRGTWIYIELPAEEPEQPPTPEGSIAV